MDGNKEHTAYFELQDENHIIIDSVKIIVINSHSDISSQMYKVLGKDHSSPIELAVIDNQGVKFVAWDFNNSEKTDPTYQNDKSIFDYSFPSIGTFPIQVTVVDSFDSETTISDSIVIKGFFIDSRHNCPVP